MNLLDWKDKQASQKNQPNKNPQTNKKPPITKPKTIKHLRLFLVPTNREEIKKFNLFYVSSQTVREYEQTDLNAYIQEYWCKLRL